MAGSRWLLVGRLRVVAWVAGAALLAGCSASAKSSQAAQPLPPQSVEEKAPQSPPAAENPVGVPTTTETLVVIDPGQETAGQPQSLAEAAAAERERRQNATPPAVVITDKNLAEFAAGKVLTVASPESRPQVSSPSEGPAAVATEEYWRGLALAARLKWRAAVDQIGELERAVADFRQRFYGTDDPYVRDTQVKPAWDRALEELAAARKAAAEGQAALTEVLERGRHEGALPGWLRDGIEHEPVLTPPAPPPGEPTEPVELEEPPR